MTEILKYLLVNLISEKCFDKYFYEYDFFDGACFKIFLSKGLGLGIIAGSMMVKIPQILKIQANKSGEGINLISVLLDLFAITCHSAYSFVSGYPFSSWGEGAFLGIQTALIALLILAYGSSASKATAFLILYSTIVYVLMSGLTPHEYLLAAQACNIPIIIVGKFTQAWTNYNNKGTGQLSAATCFMLFAGSLARIFTSIQETGDNMIILTYLVSSAVNGMIVAQMLYYWDKPSKKKSGKQNKAITKTNAKGKGKSKKAD